VIGCASDGLCASVAVIAPALTKWRFWSRARELTPAHRLKNKYDYSNSNNNSNDHGENLSLLKILYQKLSLHNLLKALVALRLGNMLTSSRRVLVVLSLVTFSFILVHITFRPLNGEKLQSFIRGRPYAEKLVGNLLDSTSPNLR